MDIETMVRLEKEADERDQTAAVLAHWKRQADRRESRHFWFNWRQIVNDPVVAAPTPEATPSVSGVGPGATGSIAADPPAPPTLPATGPGDRIPGGPPHLPPAAR